MSHMSDASAASALGYDAGIGGASMEVVTRIAPSPTGDPHVGTAYIGLFNYVFARRHGGRFIFRLEDTDRQRYQAGAEARILEMFAWLGLQPDESPEVGGPNGPYRQSERLAVYHAHVEELLAAGRAYRAFETAEEIEAMRLEQKRLGKPIGYDGRGRDLPPAEQARRHAAGEPNVVRLMTADEGATTFRDRLRGDVTIPNSEIRDPVLMKSDGYPTYHLANVVDDHLMGVTHVIRAEEWVTSTPIHVLLYRAIGWDLPEFIHMPLLRNPDRSKVSKRKLDTSVDSYRQQGFLPEALLNFLANMGWSMPDGREYFGVKDMTAEFDIDRVSLGGPVFDLKKLRSFNAKYLRDILPLEEVAERAKPLLEDRGTTAPTRTTSSTSSTSCARAPRRSSSSSTRPATSSGRRSATTSPPASSSRPARRSCRTSNASCPSWSSSTTTALTTC